MAAISRTYERDGGFKIMLQENRKKAATLLLPGVSQRIVGGGEKKLLLVHLLHSRSRHLVASLLPPLSLLTHSHKLPPLFSPSSRETQAFYLQKQHPHHLIPPPPPLPWSHTRTRRSPSCPRFVYFTPLHNARINFSKPI